MSVLKKEILQTTDGSNTLYVPELDETYHSTNGALQESLHVFIKEGLQYLALKSTSILEIGFGTGLNALTTFAHAAVSDLKINYSTIEAFPLDWDSVAKLKYHELEGLHGHAIAFKEMHTSVWEEARLISPSFSLKKLNLKLQNIAFDNEFDVIYFDAFAPQVQPELWTEEVLALLYKALKSKGVLVTYCAKGSVKRALKSVGFQLQSIPGPPGKREMSRAIKT
tara:strand:+ start:520 stop:1191 length:672 start_codon:yes stop_codon:yes gene_type:complete